MTLVLRLFCLPRLSVSAGCGFLILLGRIGMGFLRIFRRFCVGLVSIKVLSVLWKEGIRSVLRMLFAFFGGEPDEA